MTARTPAAREWNPESRVEMARARCVAATQLETARREQSQPDRSVRHCTNGPLDWSCLVRCVAATVYARRLPHHDAEDIVQRTMLEVVVRVAAGKEVGEIGAFARCTARRECLDWCRARRRRCREEPIVAEPRAVDGWSARSWRDEPALHATMRGLIVEAARSVRSGWQRQLFEMHFVQGLSIEEVARRAGRRPDNVRRDVRAILARIGKRRTS